MARKSSTHKLSSNRNSKSNRPGGNAMGEVRIIGGDWRGRKLPVLTADGLRPTSDRVRETVFNWLQFEVPGAQCLDVFAGSGALGLEALSRGASWVTLLELNTANANQLKQNLNTLKSEKAEVIQADSLLWLVKASDQIYDLIFLDPPFKQGLMQPAVDLIFKNGFLNTQQAWLYLEQEKQLEWPSLPEGWVCFREKSTSQVKYALFKQE